MSADEERIRLQRSYRDRLLTLEHANGEPIRTRPPRLSRADYRKARKARITTRRQAAKTNQ